MSSVVEAVGYGGEEHGGWLASIYHRGWWRCSLYWVICESESEDT